MIKLLLTILIMALISSLAMWVGKNDGNVVIEWFGWELTTKPAFFILFLITLYFFLYIVISLIKIIIILPTTARKKILNNRLKKSEKALYKGIIASSYGNKDEVYKNLPIAKKSLKPSPLLALLELQYSLFKKNDKDSFSVLSKMLKNQASKPLAIKGLISYARKKKDIELFTNMLNKSLEDKIDFSWINQDVISFCIENNNWTSLSNFLESKFSINNKKYRYMLSIINYHIAKDFFLQNDNIRAKIFIQKALNLNKFFPPILDLYCKLKIEKNKNKLIKRLKSYWSNNPHPNIENCINNSLDQLDDISRLQSFIKILNKNDDFYFKHLIIGKLKYKAKIWGESKVDLKKSLSLKPSKEAYYYLYKIEKKFSNDQSIISNWENLYNKTQEEAIWKCSHCSAANEDWEIYCMNCKSFDSIKFNAKKLENFNFNIQNSIFNTINVK